MKLYEITDEIRQLTELADDVDITDTLEGLTLEFEDKCVQVGFALRELRAEHAAINDEIDRLKKRQASKKARAERLEQYLLENMRAANVRRVEHAISPVAIKKNPARVVIPNADAVPPDYMNSKIISTPDKTKIKQALYEGLKANWAALEASESIKL